ncbi:MAG: hypothetical protein IPK82_25855 [Polyangiaceae bacterium]|nr:hypothetical protein [Polyangiaceae bacterium]
MRFLRSLAAVLLLSLPLVSGCGDDKKPSAPTPESVVAPEVTSGPIAEIVPPPSVLAWGGADNVEALVSGLQTFGQNVSPLMPRAFDLMQDELRRRLAMTKLEGLDWKKPARVVMFDPKASPKGQFALVLGLANREQLLSGLPPTTVKKNNDEGNAITYRDDLGRNICLNFIDTSVVITWDKKQFAPNTELFARLVRATTQGKDVFYLSAQNTAALYSKEIDDMAAQVKQQMTSGPQAVPGMQAEVSLRVLTWMVQTFKELDKIEVTPSLPQDGVVLSIRLHPKADSALQKSFQAIEAKSHDLIARFPADSTVFASFSTNPDVIDGLTTRLVEWAMSVGYGGKVPEQYSQTMRDYFQATSGQVALAVHKPFGGEGLTLTTLMTVRDEEKLRTSMRKSKETLKDKALVEMLKATGTTLEYKENAYKVGTIPVDTVTAKFDKQKNPLSPLGPFGDAIGDLSNTHNAVTKDLAIIAYGSDAKKTIEAYVNGKAEGGLDKAAGVTRAFKMGVQNPVGIVYISPVEMAKRAAFGGKNPFAESLKDLAGTSGAAISFTAKGGILELVIDVPGEVAKNSVQAAARAKALFPQ